MTAARDRWEATQRGLWGQRPQDWAQLAEPQNRELMLAALDAAGVGADTTLLDLGCGSGLALQLAAARGTVLAGIDISPELLAVARERVPGADLREGGLDALPFPSAATDAVLAVNALQFAYDPNAALGEAARVLRPGGRIAIAGFSAPERCESTALHEVMETLVPAAEHEDHAPYALAAPGALGRALSAAGLRVLDERELAGDWVYADVPSAVRGVLCSAGGTRAIRAAGEARVSEALRSGLQRFVAGDGSVVMHNHFRLTVAVAVADGGAGGR